MPPQEHSGLGKGPSVLGFFVVVVIITIFFIWYWECSGLLPLLTPLF